MKQMHCIKSFVTPVPDHALLLKKKVYCVFKCTHNCNAHMVCSRVPAYIKYINQSVAQDSCTV